MPESPTPVLAFEGRISRTLAESDPCFAEPPHPGEDAPNVVIVLLDDTGFARLGCGGAVKVGDGLHRVEVGPRVAGL